MSDDRQIKAGRLAGKSLPTAIVLVAAPVLLEQFLAAFVGLVDKVLTGGLPTGATAALDGVGIGAYVGWFIGISLSALGIGGLAIISRSLGKGDVRSAELGLGQATTFSVIWGVILAFALHAAAPLLAKIGGLSPEAAEACTVYVRRIALGLPFASLTMVGIMSLHGAGEAVRPFFIMLVVNIVNIVVSWQLSGSVVAVFGRSFASSGAMGVEGIATGTVISRIVGAVLVFALIVHGVQDLRLRRWALRPDSEMLRRIIRVGLPAFGDGMAMWVGNILVVGIVGMIAAQQALELGLVSGTQDGLIGAHIIGVQWEAFSFLPGFALGTAAATLVGQYLGAGNREMATRAIWACTAVAAVFMGAAGFGFIFGGEFLTRQISRDPLHLEIAPELLRICGFVQVFFAMAMVIREAIKGAGDTRWALWINLIGTYGIRVPFSYWIGYKAGGGLVGVWWVLCLEIVVRALLFLVRLLHGGWKRIEV